MTKEQIQGWTMALLVIIPITVVSAAFIMSIIVYNESIFQFLAGAFVGFATSQASRYSRWVGGAAIDADATNGNGKQNGTATNPTPAITAPTKP